MIPLILDILSSQAHRNRTGWWLSDNERGKWENAFQWVYSVIYAR